jgi:diadenosine tetraphosphate (Ap4A) HIT family hydrolase
MIQIPQAEGLATGTMNRIFDNTAATYKFYWLLSLLDMHIREQRTEMLALDVASRMVAYAWYPVEYFRLPYKSLVSNKGYKLYQYQHFNKLPRKEGERCPFCKLSHKVEIICETATCVAFYDGYPVSPGHALIIPKRHVANYFDLTNHEREAMNVFHCHMHLIPRYKGDVPNPKGGVRGVIPSKQKY